MVDHPAQGTHQPDTIWNKNFMFILLANFFVVHSYLMLSPTFPIYIEDLGFAQDIIGIVAGMFTVTAILSRPFVGHRLDTSDRRNLYLTGQAISVVSIVLYYLFSNIYVLILIRLIHGIGIGITTSAANTIATDFIPKNRMGEGVGYFSLSVVFAMAISPAVGLALLEYGGYAALFYASALLGAVGFLFGYLVRYSPERKRALLSKAEARPKLEWRNMFEKTAIRPAVTMFMCGLSFNAISFFLALYAESRQVGNIGLYFTVYAVALFVSRPMAGKFGDRYGYTHVIIPGIVLTAASLVLLYFADALWIFLISAAIYGIGYGAAQSNLQAMSVARCEPNRRGAAVSTFYTGLDLCIIVGSTTGGFMAKHFGYDVMYLLTAIPVLLSIAVFLLLGRMDRRFLHETAKGEPAA
jgi:MFS family permease